MKNRILRGRPPQAAAGLLLALVLAASGAVPSARAQLFDARTMAMGGVKLSTDRGDISRVNPAYRAVPRIAYESPHAFPLPLGLIQAIDDFPEVDPGNPDFNLIGLIDYALNPPFALELGRPSDPTNDIELSLAQDRLVIDLKDAQRTIPDEPFHIGGRGRFLDLGYNINLGADMGGVLHLSFLEGFTENELEVDLDDRLRSVLKDAEPLVGGRNYGFNGDGIVQGGFTSGFSYAREVTVGRNGEVKGEEGDWAEEYWKREGDRTRIWVGAGWKHYFGLGYARLNGDVSLRGEDPLFADADSFSVDYEAFYTRAYPNGFDIPGHGNALEAGMVVRWRRAELGVGVADLFADITWQNSDRERYSLGTDALGNRVARREFVAKGAETRTEIPESWLVNMSYRLDKALVAGDVGGGPGGTSAHGGFEVWLVPSFALRGGLEIDQRGELQAGWGTGVRFASVGVDLGFRTHSRSFSGERAVSLGLSLVLY